jgi:DNA replication protein DnaC
MEAQEKIIDLIRNSPLDSYFFRGPTGTGKSFLMWALYKEALYHGRKAIFVTARAMIAALRKLEFLNPSEQNNDIPDLIEPHMLRRNIWGPAHLLIDEWDKTSVTPFAHDLLFSLIDYCASNPSSVVLCIATNLEKMDFCELYGEAMYRRISSITNEIWYSGGPNV